MQRASATFEDTRRLKQIVFNILGKHMRKDRFGPHKVKAVIRIREAKLSGGKATARIVGGVIDIGALKMKIGVFGRDVLLAPAHTLRHNIKAVITALW